MTKRRRTRALQRAIDHFGSQVALAEALDCRPQAVWNWLWRGQVPPNRAVDIERVTRGEVKRAELRPDLFA